MKRIMPKRCPVWMVTAGFVLWAVGALAANFPEITAEQLKAKLDAGEQLLLINPLSDIEFNDQHIPGSVNIPLQNILIDDSLPEDKNHLIITYCLGRK